MRWRAGRLANGDSGQATVEFAASVSVMFLAMMGLMNMSLATYSYHYVSEAAREGCRYAMVNGSSVTTPATSDAIQTYVRGLGYPGITSSLMTVNTTWSAYPSGTVCTPSTTCNNAGNLVTVHASYAFPVKIPFFPTKTITMSSTSRMVIAQ
jgi:Flp pilus assembly protein TadG